MLPQLESGRDPQPAVITTLGSLASTNVSQFVPVIKGSLHIMITLMPQTRNDSLRIAFSFGNLCNFFFFFEIIYENLFISITKNVLIILGFHRDTKDFIIVERRWTIITN